MLKKELMRTVKSHFFDSGAFTLYTQSKKIYNDKEVFYNSKEFYSYIDKYAKFIKKYKSIMDLYANVDVIGDPELSYRNQKYLEKKYGLNPVPVIHYSKDGFKNLLKWLNKYIEEGYPVIGLGGLVGSSNKIEFQEWLDSAFGNLICNTPNHLPKTKIHGFGISSFRILFRYPWWSVDSTAWRMSAAYGNIILPKKRKGKYNFLTPPYRIAISIESPRKKIKNQHFLNLSDNRKKEVLDWLDYVKLPLGKVEKEKVIEDGVLTKMTIRSAANLCYFEELQKHFPVWPQPFIKRRKTIHDNLLLGC
jgi:hypothetical protein